MGQCDRRTANSCTEFAARCAALVACICMLWACSGSSPEPDPDSGMRFHRSDAGLRDAAIDARVGAIMDARIDDASLGARTDAAGELDATEPADADLPAEAGKPPTLKQFLDAYVAKGCDLIERCSGTGCDGDIWEMTDLRLMRDQLPREVRDGRLRFDAEQASKCLAYDATCGDGSLTTVPACTGIFRAAAGLGDDCYWPNGVEDECAEGTCNGCPGHCAIRESSGQEGDACGFESCAKGLDCRIPTLDPTHFECVPVTGKNGKCDSTTQCERGLYCSGGKCATHIALGEACKRDFECGEASVCRRVSTNDLWSCVREIADGESCQDVLSGCVDGDYCAFEGKHAVCRPKARAGDQCSDVPCAAGLRCAAADGETLLTCRAWPKVGQSCALASCAWPLKCIQDVCSQGSSSGEPCPSGNECSPELYCAADGTCKEAGGPGDACDPDRYNSCDPMRGTCGPIISNSSTGIVTQECLPYCSGPGSTALPVGDRDD
jgi:hypothetical protein